MNINFLFKLKASASSAQDLITLLSPHSLKRCDVLFPQAVALFASSWPFYSFFCDLIGLPVKAQSCQVNR